MKILINSFSVQKAGNAPHENEDAKWPLESETTLKEPEVRIAISDGATCSTYSRIWSRLLVREYGRRRMNRWNANERLPRLARVWRRVTYRPDMPWYAKAKMRDGAFATFVGLELKEADSVGRWSALACGDSVVLHERSDQLLRVFPSLRSRDFSNSPRLLGTLAPSGSAELLEMTDGEWQDGDCFYLMTDALACWYLSRTESGEYPWAGLTDLRFTNDPTFEHWIDALRERAQIKNDDCTLVVVTPELS